jgi:hypothetical protein
MVDRDGFIKCEAMRVGDHKSLGLQEQPILDFRGRNGQSCSCAPASKLNKVDHILSYMSQSMGSNIFFSEFYDFIFCATFFRRDL